MSEQYVDFGGRPLLDISVCIPGIPASAASSDAQAFEISIPRAVGIYELRGVTANCRVADTDGSTTGQTTYKIAEVFAETPSRNYWTVSIPSGQKTGRVTDSTNGTLCIEACQTFAAWVSAPGGHDNVTLTFHFERIK